MLSVIIPFHEGRNYLEDCLESIAEQNYEDIETVLVQDAMNTNEKQYENVDDIIRKYKERINLKTYRLDGNNGVAKARNKGLKEANGEFVLFLDSDDYLTQGYLSKMMRQMDAKKDLVYGNVIRTWFKRAAFHVEQGDVPEKNEEIKPIEERQRAFKEIEKNMVFRHEKIEGITCLGVVFRKEFLAKNHIRFKPEQKYYADCEFMVRVIKAKPSYGFEFECFYVKRYHNDKINLPSLSQIESDEKEESMICAYEESVEALGSENPLTDHFRKMFCRYYIDIFSRRFHDNPQNQPSQKEIDRYKKALKYLKAEETKGLGILEKKIIKAGIAGDRQRVKKQANIRLAKNKFFLMFTDKVHMIRTINLYVFHKMKIKNNYIVFESFVGRNYSGQPKYIYQYLQKNYGNKYKYIWSVNDKKIKIDGKCKKVKRYGLMYYYYMTRSKYWVLNTRQPQILRKRKGQVMLETWHGTPLKKLFFDMDEVHSADPDYKQRVYKQSREWDYLISDNPFSTEKFQSCFLYERQKILEVGYPANDPLYNLHLENRAIELKEKLGIPLDKKVLLYAPTWRDDDRYAAGEYRFRLELDLKRLKQELGDEYVVLLRMHYWVVDQLDLSGLEDFVVNVSHYNDITDIYIVSDICMTDYSSVFFDFANLKRPILFFMYDLEKYRDVLRGFYLDIEKDLPGPILLNNDQVVWAIKNIDDISEQYHEKYNQFYDKFCCIDDGQAAKRVCEKVFGL